MSWFDATRASAVGTTAVERSVDARTRAERYRGHTSPRFRVGRSENRSSVTRRA
jgi:hypothetical protein